MSSTPYTDAITARLGLNMHQLNLTVVREGNSSPAGQCARTLIETILAMESAEREATEAVGNLRDAAWKQHLNLASGHGTYDASCLVTHASRAREAETKLTTAVSTLGVFKRLLDSLLAQEAAK